MKKIKGINDFKNKLIDLLIKIGFRENDAQIIIDTYVEADMCGVYTHGLNVLPAHIEKAIDRFL